MRGGNSGWVRTGADGTFGADQNLETGRVLGKRRDGVVPRARRGRDGEVSKGGEGGRGGAGVRGGEGGARAGDMEGGKETVDGKTGGTGKRSGWEGCPWRGRRYGTGSTGLGEGPERGNVRAIMT